jgi:ubiquinone/menaquinone biosynthesis C-methylase UbiE
MRAAARMTGAGEDAAAGRPYRRRMRSTTTPWALGDYHRFAKDMVWNFGPTLVAACGIGPGQRVLDVAAGTGNVAIRAAHAGADVVASDLEPAQLEVGRKEAPDLEWVQADAVALPFADGEFDVVTSAAGVMFAPDHQAAADELVRVCRPGGTIGLITFTPEGMAGDFFRLFGAEPPTLWGDEQHVRGLFRDRVELTFARDTYIERAPGGPKGFVDYYKETFGPVIATYASLAEDRRVQLDREFLAFAERWDTGTADAELPVEYLLIVGRRA